MLGDMGDACHGSYMCECVHGMALNLLPLPYLVSSSWAKQSRRCLRSCSLANERERPKILLSVRSASNKPKQIQGIISSWSFFMHLSLLLLTKCFCGKNKTPKHVLTIQQNPKACPHHPFPPLSCQTQILGSGTTGPATERMTRWGTTPRRASTHLCPT